MSANKNAPIIIKRKKVIVGGGHHGGAWKVAYADFVTAMMAFFMLMWLLNATTETQRKGLADYFSPSIPIMRVSGGGDGSFGGDNVFTADELAQSGTGASMRNPTQQDQASGESGVEPVDGQDAQDKAAFSEVEAALTAKAGESMTSLDVQRHIVTRVTDEGLIVELFDLPGAPLFEEDSNRPTVLLENLSAIVVDVFDLVTNEVAVNGYTRSHPIVLIENPVWDISSTRADTVRKMMQNLDLPAKRIQRVTGFADRKPVVRNPMGARNNRIELILLRQSRRG